jgi:probable H4MPT-linked C1 transfer pathway protein
MTSPTLGWDIGGVNLKAAVVSDGAPLASAAVPFQIEHESSESLSAALRDISRHLGATAESHHAVTMTGELSQRFETKREGVLWILSSVEAAFSPERASIFQTDGRFVSLRIARDCTMRVAAANWRASAELVALKWPEAVFVDIGSTTTDVICIQRGRVVAQGLTDPDRLRTGELLYLGAVRTPVEAVVHQVPLHGQMAGVSAESFALLGDVYLWLGDLEPSDYCCPTPDGRPTDRKWSGERLARVVCADRELVSNEDLSAIAHHVARAQVERTAASIEQVLRTTESSGRGRAPTIVAAGIGEAIARRAANLLSLPHESLSSAIGTAAARVAPAAAVALLYEAHCAARGNGSR